MATCESCGTDIDVYWVNDDGLEGFYCDHCKSRLQVDSRNENRGM